MNNEPEYGEEQREEQRQNGRKIGIGLLVLILILAVLILPRLWHTPQSTPSQGGAGPSIPGYTPLPDSSGWHDDVLAASGSITDDWSAITNLASDPYPESEWWKEEWFKATAKLRADSDRLDAIDFPPEYDNAEAEVGKACELTVETSWLLEDLASVGDEATAQQILDNIREINEHLYTAADMLQE